MKKNLQKTRDNFQPYFDCQKGVTLLELLVSVALFSMSILMVAQVFKSVNEGQRSAIAAQNVQDNVRYAFETIGKEMRAAQNDYIGTCTETANRIYAVNALSDELYFKNYHGECVAYFWEDGYLMIERAGHVASTTPEEITVSNLGFEIIDDLPHKQSLVVVKMDIESKGKEEYKQKVKMQTTISSRNYE